MCGTEIARRSPGLGPGIELTVIIPIAGPIVEMYLGDSGEEGGAGGGLPKKRTLELSLER